MAPARSRYKGPVLALLLSLALLAGIYLSGLETDPQHLNQDLLQPLLRIMLLVSVGLAVGEIIEATGWTKYLAVLARPLFDFGRLGQRCSAAFTTAFFSGVAANSMLLGFYQEGMISTKQLFLANFVNHLPAYFLHLPTTIFLVLPLTGWVGGVYLLLVFIATLLRTFLFLLYGRLSLPRQEQEADLDPGQEQTNSSPGLKLTIAVHRIKKNLPRRLLRVLQFVLPIFILVYALNALGFFSWSRELLAQTALDAFLPLEAVSMVVVGFVADYTSGFATAGALLQKGMLNFEQGVLALLIGSILAMPLRMLRHQLPRYLGIYTPALGAKILILGQTFRALSLILVGFVFFLFFF
ncbi:MAG: nucleoside recognition domain-containing protein [Desulfohalobiaceae bacterium]